LISRFYAGKPTCTLEIGKNALEIANYKPEFTVYETEKS